MKRLAMAMLSMGAAASLAAAQVRWAEVYKSGPVTLVPDPAFGRTMDWSAFLFESTKDIAVADDGTIFMANIREHTIHKFDASGRKVLTFGRRGQGPGDLESPNSPSLLDGKYLVVGEYALRHRISLFDLDGRFYKVIKTQRPVYDVVALGGTKIAYLTRQFERQGADRRKPGVQAIPQSIRIMILDIATAAETVILTRSLSYKSIMLSAGGSLSFGDDLIGDIYLARTADGNLAVADSASAQVDIYDAQGRRVRSFHLKTAPRPVTPEYIARYKKVQIDELKSESDPMPRRQEIIKEIENLDFSPLFERILPYFIDLTTDADGNFLLFRLAEVPGKAGLAFCAYSPRGEFIAETRLDPGGFSIQIDRRFRRLAFSKFGLIGLARPKDNEDDLPVLFRTVPVPRSAR